MNTYDTLVIGGGHNGLTCAAYLAKAGQKVLLLEKRYKVGGATVSEEIVPGFHFTVFSYLVSLFRTEIMHDLQLTKHGLCLLPFETTLDLAPDGNFLYRETDHYKTYANLARHSKRDAEAYDEYKLMMKKIAHFCRHMMLSAPPNFDFNTATAPEIIALAKLLAGQEREVLTTFVQLLTLSVSDFLDYWFESDMIKSALCTSGLIGSFIGPYSPGSALVLLIHYLGEIDGQYRNWVFQKGGTGGLTQTIARAARAFGAEIRCDAPVAQLLMKGERVEGVVLESGEEIRAQRVVASTVPQLSYLKFAGEENLPADLVTKVKQWNSKGSAGKVNIALDTFPNFSAMPGWGRHLGGAFSFNVSMAGFERAYDQAKYGEYSSEPYIDAGLISVADPDLAPPGKHVMTCFVMYAPRDLKTGTWPERRAEFGANVIHNIAKYIPNFKDIVVDYQVNTPWDIEERIGLIGGNIFHGELRIGQLFGWRPAQGYSGYRTPLQNYYLCGSSTHPGGAITGAPGRNAAMQILQDSQK